MRFSSDEQRKAIFASMGKSFRNPARYVSAAAIGIGTAILTRKKLLPFRNAINISHNIMPLVNQKFAKAPSFETVKNVAFGMKGTGKGIQILKTTLMEGPFAMDFVQTRRGAGRSMTSMMQGLAEHIALSAKTPLSKGTRRVVLINPNNNSAALAHELGHLRRRNFMKGISKHIQQVGRNAEGGYIPLVQLPEEFMATMRGAYIYKKAGGSYRNYTKTMFKPQMTYIAMSGGGHDASLVAGSLTAGTVLGLTHKRKK